MKYGCCLNMIAGREDGTGLEHLKDLVQAGYDYVELPLAEMMALPKAQRQQIQGRLRQMGIRCEACNNFFPPSMRLTGRGRNMQEVMNYAREALAFAGGLGAERVVFGSGRAKNVPEGFPMDAGYAQVVELLQEIGGIAQKQQIIIAIEPLRKKECNLINTFAEGCRLAEDVGNKNVMVLVDYYHLMEEQEPIENLLTLGKKHLTHVHFSNPDKRKYPRTGEEGQYRDFAEVLKKTGYKLRISCEAYTDNYPIAGPDALALLKNVFEQEGSNEISTGSDYGSGRKGKKVKT